MFSYKAIYKERAEAWREQARVASEQAALLRQQAETQIAFARQAVDAAEYWERLAKQ